MKGTLEAYKQSEYTSKNTGKLVKGVSAFFSYEKRGYEGRVSKEVWISDDKAPKAGFAIGADYVLDYDPDGSLISVQPVKG